MNHIITVTGLMRCPNSRSGNPRWRIRSKDGFYYTARDSQVGCDVTDDWRGIDIDVVLDADGDIIRAVRAS